MGGFARRTLPHLYAELPLSASPGSAAAVGRRRKPRFFGPLAMIGHLGAPRPPAARVRGRKRASSDDRGAATFAEARARAGRSRLATKVFGLDFPNPVGLAPASTRTPSVRRDAGLGIWFCRGRDAHSASQPGNARPRVFRLLEDHAVINRYGFNNDGHAPAFEAPRGARATRNCRRQYRREQGRQRPRPGLCGGRARLRRAADYFTINISSPNTRDCAICRSRRRSPISSRASSTPARRADAPSAVAQNRARSDSVAARRHRARRPRGPDRRMIVSNTTLARPGSLRSRLAAETGGLSASRCSRYRPAAGAGFPASRGQFPLIGVGGIDGPETAFAKIEAGAALSQLYSALVYEGRGL